MKSAYKLSKFTICIMRENAIVLYNSFSGKIVMIEGRETLAMYEEFSEGAIEEIHYSERIISFLLSIGIIVPIDCDEDTMVDELEREVIGNSNVLKLIIMPTEQCNFRCKYCYETFQKGEMSKKLCDDILTFVKEQMDDRRGLNVEWFGGEPLLAMSTIRYLSNGFLDICRTRHKPYLAQMTTNGYLLTTELARELYALHVNEFQITLDGLSDTHNAQRCLVSGKETWNVVVSNIKNVLECCSDRHISILLRTNITKPIYSKLDEYLDFLVENFANNKKVSLEWRFAVDMGGDRVNEIKHDFIKEESVAGKLLAHMELAYNRGLNFTSGVFALKPAGRICYACKKNTYILGSDSLVYFCTDAFYNKYGVVATLNDGQLSDISVENIAYWKEIEMSTTIDKCRNCNIRPLCLAADCPNRRRINKEIVCPEMRYTILDYIRLYSMDSSVCKRYNWEGLA